MIGRTASIFLMLLTVGCMAAPTSARYTKDGRRIIASAQDMQEFAAEMRAQAAAIDPCPTRGPSQQAVDHTRLELARADVAQENSTAAYHILFPLSRAGDADAEYMIGNILEHTANPELKGGNYATCYRRAAEQGQTQAQQRLKALGMQ